VKEPHLISGQRGTGLRAVGDPVLGAVEDVTVAVLRGRRRRRPGVGSVARLAQREAALRESAQGHACDAVYKASDPLPGSLSAKQPCGRVVGGVGRWRVGAM
jgi:hypothetical protein